MAACWLEVRLAKKDLREGTEDRATVCFSGSDSRLAAHPAAPLAVEAMRKPIADASSTKMRQARIEILPPIEP